MAETIADSLANVLEIHEGRICAFDLPFVKGQEADTFKGSKVGEGRATGKSPEPADKNVCATLRRLSSLRVLGTFLSSVPRTQAAATLPCSSVPPSNVIETTPGKCFDPSVMNAPGTDLLI